ncbi:MAG: GGDEF domain-containing protein, partial [Burkholderiaceae bacterium]|nr:GGDEF domain-containing protein [Burkholderiaceae bacterium]
RAPAQRIQQAIRASDVAARVGGDEFLVLLADVHEDTAMETAQRLVDLLSAPYEGVSMPVSASVGVALYPQLGADWQSLAAQADQALYAAKHGGKSRAVMANPPEPAAPGG